VDFFSDGVGVILYASVPDPVLRGCRLFARDSMDRTSDGRPLSTFLREKGRPMILA
jgi:hypothetical protein